VVYLRTVYAADLDNETPTTIRKAT